MYKQYLNELRFKKKEETDKVSDPYKLNNLKMKKMLEKNRDHNKSYLNYYQIEKIVNTRKKLGLNNHSIDKKANRVKDIMEDNISESSHLKSVKLTHESLEDFLKLRRNFQESIGNSFRIDDSSDSRINQECDHPSRKLYRNMSEVHIRNISLFTTSLRTTHINPIHLPRLRSNITKVVKNNLTRSLNREVGRISNEYGNIRGLEKYKTNQRHSLIFKEKDYLAYYTAKSHDSKHRPKIRPIQYKEKAIEKLPDSIFNIKYIK